MENKEIYLGSNRLNLRKNEVSGQFVEIHSEKFYKISRYNEMPDFFMTIVSNSDHWMYLSSNGSLTAGRKNRDNALFPYYPVDKIHDYKGLTGSKTICLVENSNRSFVWEPFTDESEKVYEIQRNLYKSIYGNKVIFEEVKEDLRTAGEEFDENIPLGIMIEVPAAAALTDILVKEVDYLSIGTNDLIQYYLAVDRSNELVSYLFKPLHPSVLRMVKFIIDEAKKEGKEITVCGEMAADPGRFPGAARTEEEE